MRRTFPYVFLLTALFVGAAFFGAPHQAHALSILDIFSFSADMFYGTLGKLFWWGLIPLAGLVLQLLGLVIDTAILFSLESSFYNSPAIGLAWSIVRDICNMVFIFVLIYEGIRTILNIGNSATIKRTITSVVIAAVLLNFSLFFTKVVIDASNVTAAWFIQGIQNIGGSSSVSDSIRATLQMEKLTNKYDSGMNKTSFSLESFTIGFLLFALTCVAIYVFFSVVFLIVGRIVAFIYLLIMSPLGFVGTFVDVPQIKEYGQEWRKELLAQAMMLPMFFLMVYITLFIVDRVDKFVFSSSASTTDGSSFSPANYVIFIVIIMMLLRALKTAQKYSGEIGGMVGNVFKSAVGFATGAVALRTVGAAATAIKSSEGLQQAAARGSFLAKQTLRASDAVAKKDFGAGGAYKALMSSAGLKDTAIAKQFKDADKGYSGLVDREKKKETEFAKMLGKGKAGEENRMRYAQSLERSAKSGIYYNTIGRMGMERAGALGAAGDIRDAAAKAYLKAEKEDPKKKAEKAKAELVYQELRKRDISRALGSNDASVHERAIGAEIKETSKVLKSQEAELKKVTDAEILDLFGKEKERAALIDGLGGMSDTEAAAATARINQLDKELGDEEKAKIERYKLEKQGEADKEFEKYDGLKKKIEANKKTIEDLSEAMGRDTKTIEDALKARREGLEKEIEKTKESFDKAKGEAKTKREEYSGLDEGAGGGESGKDKGAGKEGDKGGEKEGGDKGEK